MLIKDVLFGIDVLGLADFLLYCLTAIIAHFLMSLGQTLFHRYLGHSRLGGRFFKNHIQFHHVHYAGDHVVSTHYLDNGDNNTLFFLTPVVLVIGLSSLFLRLDLLVVQLAAMSLSFCGHYYLDNGDNNTLFFVMPVAVVVGLSYLFLRLDLLVVQLWPLNGKLPLDRPRAPRS